MDESINVGFSSQLCRVAQERAEQCSKLNSMEGLEIEISIDEKWYTVGPISYSISLTLGFKSDLRIKHSKEEL